MKNISMRDGELKWDGGTVHAYNIYQDSERERELLAIFTSYKEAQKYLADKKAEAKPNET